MVRDQAGKCNFGQYLFMISYKKIEAAKSLYETSGARSSCYGCNDKLCYHLWDFDKQYEFEYSGRTVTTRDDQDIEPVFRIDPKDCKIVEGSMKTKENSTFEAAHRIEGIGKENARIHGHSHEVYVTISGEPDERYGWVIPHEEFRTKVGAIVNRCHTYLNEFIKNPTA